MSFWRWLEKKLVTSNDQIPIGGADVIIGVGIDVSSNGRSASPYSKSVANKCGELFKSGAGRRIIFTGGYFNRHHPGVTEAQGMGKHLTADIDSAFLTLENEANRTWLNADCTLPLIQRHERRVLVVAQQWHARRVRATFKKRWRGQGIDIRVVKAWSSYGGGSQKRLDHFWSFVFWDSCAFIISKLRGYC